MPYEIARVIEKVTFRKSKRLHYVLSQIAMIRAIDKPRRELRTFSCEVITEPART